MRRCPVCHEYATHPGDILACLNDITPLWYIAKCHCRKCDSTWVEKAPTRINRQGVQNMIVRRGNHETQTK
jgi:hypothetical protein